MINKVRITNFKSILKEEILLGRVNVFIGENGCGKSNLLEAIGFASCAKEGKLDVEGFYSKGIRAAKPSLLFSSFLGKSQKKEVEISFDTSENIPIAANLVIDVESGTNSKWKDLTMREPWNLDKTGLDALKRLEKSASYNRLKDYVIYTPSTAALRGVSAESKKMPLGINGENLDVLLAAFSKEEMDALKAYNYLITWLSDFEIDRDDKLKFRGFKPNRTTSLLYFRDRFMKKTDNFFSAENANEGVLHLLFYLTLLISKHTPHFFAIDNIENNLNPHLCTEIMKIVSKLAKENDRQLLITTHNPAILDGLNLNDDDIRLFEVFRNDEGQTQTRRIKLTADTKPQKMKLSELWTRGYLGAISKNF